VRRTELKTVEKYWKRLACAILETDGTSTVGTIRYTVHMPNRTGGNNMQSWARTLLLVAGGILLIILLTVFLTFMLKVALVVALFALAYYLFTRGTESWRRSRDWR
jgi:hypothetical protein